MRQIVADFHYHSKYSRATSKQMTLENLYEWSIYKGVNLLATADFTHPLWFSELDRKLEEAEPGLYKLKKIPAKFSPNAFMRFIFSTEISLIYSDKGKTRRVHLLVMMPTNQSARKFAKKLSQIGNIYSDGRPILGLSSYDLTAIALGVDKKALVIPAHIWTPWFSVLGSKSGYNSVRECFGDLTSSILAYETGLSADPAMCWRVSELDNFAMISNGDSHSLPNIAREATIFNVSNKDKLSYNLIWQMLKQGGIKARQRILEQKPNKKFHSRGGIKGLASHLASTIEFYPEEGKYHWSGHRACSYKTDHAKEYTSNKTQDTNNIQKFQIKKFKPNNCPVCHKPLTLGVMYRVNELADRPVGYKPSQAVPFQRLVQLHQIISEAIGVGKKSKAVAQIYHQLLNQFSTLSSVIPTQAGIPFYQFGSEIDILRSIPLKDLQDKNINSKIILGIKKARQENITIDPGYDGEYGKVRVFTQKEVKRQPIQKTLFNTD